MNNSEIFQTELRFILNDSIRELTAFILDTLPDYFSKVGASTTGKYHPAYIIGEGGLIRHTKAAVAIAQDLFRADFYNFTDKQKDVVTSALILHDGLKCGKDNSQPRTAFDHPLLMSHYILKSTRIFLSENKIYNTQDFRRMVKSISKAVASHMGKWNTSNYSDIVLPLPKTDTQKCVHLCDYLASRKHLTFDFDVYADMQMNRKAKIIIIDSEVYNDFQKA